MDPPGDPAVGPHVLVGRDEDIAALERALDSRAPARAVELLGDPGMGKTSLLGEFAARAANHEVFLVSRMRERYAHAGRARDAIVTGYAQSGRVVIAAATIMTGVFGGFVLDADPVVKSIGLSLAVGVIADAFIVRLTLVPAVMALLGRAAWWLPRPVDRLVPDLDIEGEHLMQTLHTARA